MWEPVGSYREKEKINALSLQHSSFLYLALTLVMMSQAPTPFIILLFMQTSTDKYLQAQDHLLAYKSSTIIFRGWHMQKRDARYTHTCMYRSAIQKKKRNKKKQIHITEVAPHVQVMQLLPGLHHHTTHNQMFLLQQ